MVARLLQLCGFGSPADRLKELLVLQKAGRTRFLGPRTTFGTHEVVGTFTVCGALENPVVRTHSLIEAPLPASTLSPTEIPLLRRQFTRGLITQEPTGTGKLLVDRDANALTASGLSHEWLIPVGAVDAGVLGGAQGRLRVRNPTLPRSGAGMI